MKAAGGLPKTVTLCAAVVLGASGMACGSGSPSTSSSDEVTPGDARAAVVAFVGDAAMTGDLVVTGPEAGPQAALFTVQGARLSATVDARDGHVASVLFVDRTPATGGAPLDAARAESIASAFLAGHGIPTAGEAETKLLDHGETAEFVVTWQETVNQILVPNTRVVGVDAASGEVFRYLDVRRAFTDPGSPRLAQADAAAAAIKAAAIAGASVDRTEVWLQFDPSGQQYLAWRFEVSGPEPTGGAPGIQVHAMVEVNDGTGAAVVIGRG